MESRANRILSTARNMRWPAWQRIRGCWGGYPDGIPFVLAVAASALFLLREHRIAGLWGFSLDDSWIHAVIARNLAEGHGYTFNPGESVSGSTAPLYTLLLALLYRATGNMIWSAKVFGVLCHAAASAVIARAAVALDPPSRGRALLAGALYAASPLLVWGSVSGMEIPLYLLLVSLGILLYVQGRVLGATALWALGVWVRPDGILLLLVGLTAPGGARLKRLAVAASIAGGFMLFNFLVGGIAVPQSVVAKTRLGLTGLGSVWTVIREWGILWGVPYRSVDDPAHPIVLLPFMLVGAAALLRRYPVVSVFPFALPLALGVAAGSSGSHGRYLFPVIPFGILLAIAGLDAVARRVPLQRLIVPPAALAIILLLWQGANAVEMSARHAWNVQNVNQMQRWFGTAAGRITAPRDVIATNDIGAIGYFSRRRIVDLVGLVSRRRSLPENLTIYRPKLVIVYASWFEAYLRTAANDVYFSDADSLYRYSGLLGVQLRHNTINSRSRMVAFIRHRPDEPAPGRRVIYYH